MKGWEIADKIANKIWIEKFKTYHEGFYAAAAFGTLQGIFSGLILEIEIKHPEIMDDIKMYLERNL